MCDMDGGGDSGFDVGTDADVSEGTDFESSSDIDAVSSFAEMDDVSFDDASVAEDLEADTESFGENFEVDDFDTDLEATNEFSSLDDFDDVEAPLLEDSSDWAEWESEAEGDPEILDAMDPLAESDGVNIEDLDEIIEDIPEDDVKVLTREITDEVLESRERDTEVVLDNYRENLEARGVGEEQIAEFLDQERDKINAEYESLDRGDTSSNIYEMPSDWDAVAESISEQGDESASVEMPEIAEVSDVTLEVMEEEEDTTSLADLPDIDNESDFEVENIENVEDVSNADEEDAFEEVGEGVETEEAEAALNEIGTEESEDIENLDEAVPIEEDEEIAEEVEEGSFDEEFTDNVNEVDDEEFEESDEITNEVQETEINYDEIYEGLQQEALEQGFEDVDILADPERLDSALENFEESNWESLSLDDQKESMSELAEYVEETIGFENPPQIEYYNNPREGDYGGYNSATNTLQVNEYMLYNSSEAADTIAHELWHAHQRECAENPQSARDYQYQYNFENYITPDLDHQAYENQLIEAEARAFAAQFKGRLANISGRAG